MSTLYIPGIIATVFKARNTRNVLSAAKLPRSIPIVTYLFVGWVGESDQSVSGWRWIEYNEGFNIDQLVAIKRYLTVTQRSPQHKYIPNLLVSIPTRTDPCTRPKYVQMYVIY